MERSNRVFLKCFHWIQNNNIFKRLLYSNSLSPVWEAEILSLCHRYTANREDPNSCFGDLSDSLNLPKSVNLMRVLLHLGKTPIEFFLNKFILQIFVEICRFLLNIFVKNGIRTHCLLCKKWALYLSARKAQVTETTFKIMPFHASVIFQILGIHRIQQISVLLG